MAQSGPSEPDYYREMAPSELAEAEMSFPRLLGTIGLGLAVFGAFVIVMNMTQERFFGPTFGGVALACGLAGMLMHAARDPDVLIRRGYAGFGFLCLAAGLAVSLIPKPVVGDWLLPWGYAGLLVGLFFVTAAGRHEDELPWTTLIPGVLALLGAGGTLVGFGGTAVSIDYLPRFLGISLLGLVFWWSAVLRLGTANPLGYRLGQYLGLVGVLAVAWGLGRSLAPPLLHAAGAWADPPTRYFVPRGLVLTILGVLASLLSAGLCSDRVIVTLTRRELAAYFYTPIGYLVLVGVTVIGWINYLTLIGVFFRSGGGIAEPVVGIFFKGFLTAVVALAVVPVICMRLVSEEKRSGTLEVLLTAPVGEVQLVLSKFFAALLYFLFIFVPWGLFLIPAYYVGKSGFDYLPVLSFFLSLVCTGAAFVATGLFCSTVTKNQIVAAVLSFVCLFVYLLLPALERLLVPGHPIGAALEKLSFLAVWDQAVDGSMQWHQLVTYLSLTVMWLFLSVKVLEARKWS